MLSFQTVLPDTLELLKVLMQQPLFDDLRLVGGTSLALQYLKMQTCSQCPLCFNRLDGTL